MLMLGSSDSHMTILYMFPMLCMLLLYKDMKLLIRYYIATFIIILMSISYHLWRQGRNTLDDIVLNQA